MFKQAFMVTLCSLTGIYAQIASPENSVPADIGDPASRHFSADVLTAAKTYSGAGDTAGAEAYLMKAELMLENAGVAPIAHIPILMKLDDLYSNGRQQNELISVRTKLLANWTAAVGANELIVANQCERLAGVLAQAGQTAQALMLWNQAIACLKGMLGPNHPAIEFALVRKLNVEQKLDGPDEKARTLSELRAVRAAVSAASGPAPSQKVERAGGNVVAPRVVSRRDPSYSEKALAAKLQGTVLLTLIVGANGIPDRIQVFQPLGMGLDEAAEASVRSWVFNPGTKNGVPVPVKATVEVNFKLL